MAFDFYLFPFIYYSRYIFINIYFVTKTTYRNAGGKLSTFKQAAK
jgi:hypothetical protein